MKGITMTVTRPAPTPSVHDILASANVTPSYAVSNDNFIPTRYPYTYAYDFVRSHPHMVPAEIADRHPDFRSSRAETSGLVKDWCESTGVNRERFSYNLADAYLLDDELPLPDNTPNKDLLDVTSTDVHLTPAQLAAAQDMVATKLLEMGVIAGDDDINDFVFSVVKSMNR